MSQQNGYATAEDFLARNRKDVELPSGLKVQIRKLRVGDILEAMPGENLRVAADRMKAGLEDEARAERWLDGLVCRAVVSPRLVMGRDAKDGELAIEDLADDLYALRKEVQVFSLGAGGVAEASFRAVGGESGSGQNGEAVRTTAEQGAGDGA